MVLVLAGGLGAAFGPAGVKVHQLDNGLKVLLVEDHDIPNVALYTFFRVGSRNERPGLTGVSHFIEHMMFNGTEKFGPGEFDRTMEFRGGRNNAYTSLDLTAYTDWFPAAALEHMIDMEANRIQGLTFVPEVFESERGVIASERRLGVENDNDAILQENVRATAIMAHPYHWDVIGWMSDILSWRRDEVIASTDYARPTRSWSSSATSTRPRRWPSSRDTTARSRRRRRRRRSRRPSRPRWARRTFSSAKRPRRRPSMLSGTPRASANRISFRSSFSKSPCSPATATGSTAASSATSSSPSASPAG
jgi:hypothetical protein